MDKSCDWIWCLCILARNWNEFAHSACEPSYASTMGDDVICSHDNRLYVGGECSRTGGKTFPPIIFVFVVWLLLRKSTITSLICCYSD